MTADVLGRLYDGGVPFVLGILMLLYGYRVLGKKAGEDLKYDERHARFGPWFRIVGPLMILGGMVQGLRLLR